MRRVYRFLVKFFFFVMGIISYGIFIVCWYCVGMFLDIRCSCERGCYSVYFKVGRVVS